MSPMLGAYSLRDISCVVFMKDNDNVKIEQHASSHQDTTYDSKRLLWKFMVNYNICLGK